MEICNGNGSLYLESFWQQETRHLVLPTAGPRFFVEVIKNLIGSVLESAQCNSCAGVKNLLLNCDIFPAKKLQNIVILCFDLFHML